MKTEELDGRTESIIKGVARFCSDNGLGGNPSLLSSPEIIESYLKSSTLAPSTKGTYRWVLSATFGIDLKKGLSFPGSLAPKPYSRDERAELVSIANSQNKAWQRYSALSMIALSIGAGTRASELRSIRGKDLSGDGGNITISNRVVQIKSPWDRILSSLKPVDDEEFLFHPNAQNRNSKNFINNFADNLMRDPGSQRFQVARARASFICDRWNENISLRDLLYITGIDEVESLIRYVHLIDGAPKTKAGLRRLAANGTP